MHEIVSQILLQVAKVWRRKWYAVGVAWLVCIAGWATVPFLPDRFQSSARLYIDTDSLLRPLLRGLAVETNPDRELDIMRRSLRTRPNLEKVARMTDMDLAVRNSEQMETLIANLRSKIKIRSETRNLFSISYVSQDPKLAQRVVQALLTIYVESNLGTTRTELDSAQRFLDGQIAAYERKLEEAEQRLADFKRKNMGKMPGSSGYYQRYYAALGALAGVRAQLEDAMAGRTELERQLKIVPQFFEANLAQQGFGPPTGLVIRILELEKAVDDMLTRYTERHPDVVTARRRLDNLRAELAAEDEAIAPDSEETGPQGAVGKISNPIYEQIKLTVVQLEATIAQLRGAVTRAETSVARLKGLANEIPEVEAELTRLNRNYGIIKRNYEALLGRRESAYLSEEREIKGEKAVFRIIEPPQVPIKPSGPPRPLYLTVILVAGIGAGIAFAFLIANMRQTFLATSQIKKVFEMPILGSVSEALTTAKRSWRALGVTSLALVFAGLIGTYGGLLSIERSVGLHNVLPADVVEKVKVRLKQYAPTGDG